MPKKKKCVVWDLDNTLWNGVIAEGDSPEINQKLVDLIKNLDSRGVLHSIASRNEFHMAMKYIKDFNLNNIFLYPGISWGDKSESILSIANSLNIGLESMVLVDDQAFEREQVRHELPQVECYTPEEILDTDRCKALFPEKISEDSRSRRQLYKVEAERKREEKRHGGNKQQFLKGLNLVMSIAPVNESDFLRAQELTERTHQLNTTGYTYCRNELEFMSKSHDFLVLTASLKDRFGSYGNIGLCVIKKECCCYVIKLFLLSCRVINRGVAGAFLQYILSLARADSCRLRAEYKPNGRNKQMLLTYKFAGFGVVKRNEETVVDESLTTLEHCQDAITLAIDHVTVIDETKNKLSTVET